MNKSVWRDLRRYVRAHIEALSGNPDVTAASMRSAFKAVQRQMTHLVYRQRRPTKKKAKARRWSATA